MEPNARPTHAHRTYRILPVLLALWAALIGLTPAARSGPAEGGYRAEPMRRPLGFEVNRGQSDKQVDYLCRGRGFAMFLTPGETVMALARPGERDSKSPDKEKPAAPFVIRLKLSGANLKARVEADKAQAGRASYLIGDDPSKWRTDVPIFEEVWYRGVYPGVDLRYHGVDGMLKYDFVVAPGADPAAIALWIDGPRQSRVDEEGRLQLGTLEGEGEVVLDTPVVYQEVNGKPVSVSARYVLDANQVRFEMGAYDSALPLVIDPVLLYSSFVGGSAAESATDIAVDASGNTYIVGSTFSSDLPIYSGYDNSYGGNQDAFVAKFNQYGSLVYTTYLGGAWNDYGVGIAVGSDGNIYAGGRTEGGFPLKNQFSSSGGLFVTRLNPSQSGAAQLVYSTRLGGGTEYYGGYVALGAAPGIVYVAGQTSSSYYPIRGTAFDSSLNGPDTVVTKVDTDKTFDASVPYSTFLGGTGSDQPYDIAVGQSDAGSNDVVYVVGRTNTAMGYTPTLVGWQPGIAGGLDGFVAKLDLNYPAAQQLRYLTYLGGSVEDAVLGVAVEGTTGIVCVTGKATSSNFPTTPNPLYSSGQSFIAKLDTTQSGSASAIYSTRFGPECLAIAVDTAGAAYVTGAVASGGLVPLDAVQEDHGGGTKDAFVSKIAADGGAQVYSTYLGGWGEDTGKGIALDAGRNAYVTGNSNSCNFPGFECPCNEYYRPSVASFVVKIRPTVSLLSVSVNPSELTGAGSSTGTVTLDAPAPSNVPVNLIENSPYVTLKKNGVTVSGVTVLMGQTTATFTAEATSVTSQTNVTMTASYDGVVKNASLTLNPQMTCPSPPSLATPGITIVPTSVAGGTLLSGSVTLAGNAVTNGQVVALSSSSPAAMVPGTVVVPAGSSTATFTITTSPVPANTSVTITASYAGVSRTDSFTVTPATADGSPGALTLDSNVPNGYQLTTFATGFDSPPVDVVVTNDGGALVSTASGQVFKFRQDYDWQQAWTAIKAYPYDWARASSSIKSAPQTYGPRGMLGTKVNDKLTLGKKERFCYVVNHAGQLVLLDANNEMPLDSSGNVIPVVTVAGTLHSVTMKPNSPKDSLLVAGSSGVYEIDVFASPITPQRLISQSVGASAVVKHNNGQVAHTYLYVAIGAQISRYDIYATNPTLQEFVDLSDDIGAGGTVVGLAGRQGVSSPGLIVASCSDGNIWGIPDDNPSGKFKIAGGGSGGSLIGYGSNGTLYITQADRVMRLSAPPSEGIGFFGQADDLPFQPLRLTEQGISKGYRLTTFAYGFLSHIGIGPMGVTHNDAREILVSVPLVDDEITGHLRGIYQFPTNRDGQDVSSYQENNLDVLPVPYHYGFGIGLVNHAGFIYLAGYDDQVDQRFQDGSMHQIMLSGNGISSGIAADLASGDLFVAQNSGKTVTRFDPRTKTASEWLSRTNLPFFESTSKGLDGIQISDDGVLYAASPDDGYIRGWRITDKALVFQQQILQPSDNSPDSVDGIALGRGAISGRIIVNCNSGNVYEMLLDPPYTKALIATSWARGDHIGYAPDGTLLLTQTDRIMRLIPPDVRNITGGSHEVHTRDDLVAASRSLVLSSPNTLTSPAIGTTHDATFDALGIEGTVVASHMLRSGQLTRSVSNYLDIEQGVRSRDDAGLLSFPRAQKLAAGEGTGAYLRAWPLEPAFQQEIQQRLGQRYSLQLLNRASATCGNYALTDAPQPYGGTIWDRNALTVVVAPSGNPQIPQGRALAITAQGNQAPRNGTWDIVLDGAVVGSSGAPNGWDVEADTNPNHSGYNSFWVTVPGNAWVATNYQVRHWSFSASRSGTFDVVPALSRPIAPVLLPLQISPNPAQGGMACTLTVSLDAAAHEDVRVALAGDRITLPVTSVLIPAGATSAAPVSFTSPSYQAFTPAAIKASYNGVRRTELRLKGTGANLPDEPYELVAFAGDGKVTLDWSVTTVSGDVDTYDVWRSERRGGPYTLVFGNIPSARPGYIDLDVRNGTTYYYVVDAVNAYGKTRSYEVAATPSAGTAEAPTFQPNGGTHSGRVTVSLASATPGASIRYTLDGSDPTAQNTASKVYSGPFTLVYPYNAPVATVKAQAVREGYQDSGVAFATFTLDPYAYPNSVEGIDCAFGTQARALAATDPWSVVQGAGFHADAYQVGALSQEQTTLDFTVTSSAFPVRLYLIDAAGRVVAQSAEGKLRYRPSNSGNFPYYLEVTSAAQGQTGSYGLTLACNNNSPLLQVQEVPVQPDVYVDNGSLFDLGTRDFSTQAYPEKEFQISNAGGAPLRLSVGGLPDGFDLQIVSPYTVPIPAELAAGTSHRFKVRFAPKTPGRQQGVFALASIDSTNNPFNILLTAKTSGAAPIDCPQGVTGRLDRQDGTTVRRSSYADKYTFNASANQTLTIEMASGAFQPFLYLAGPDGVKSSDPNHPGDVARIVHRFTTGGTYTIEAVSFGPYAEGDYSLAVLCGNETPTAKLELAVDGKPVPADGTVDFGATEVGVPVSKTLTVTNVGTASFSIGSGTVTGDFEAVPFPVGTLYPGSRVTSTLTFKATTAPDGIYTGSLSLSNTSPGQNPFQIILRGTIGLPAQVVRFTLEPSGVSTGETVIGKVVLNRPAPANGLLLTLDSSHPSVAPVPALTPALLAVPAGIQEHTLSIVTSGSVTEGTAVELTVGGGGTEQKATLTVVPNWSVATGASPTILSAGGTTTISATVSAGQGVPVPSIQSVAFFYRDASDREFVVPGTIAANGNTYSVVWTDVPAETYQIQARAISVDGVTKVSSPVTVTVNPGGTLSVPSILPGSGTHTSAVTVEIRKSSQETEEGITLYYRLDNLPPDAQTPSSNAILYTGPFLISRPAPGAGPTTVTARAYKRHRAASDPASATYTWTGGVSSPPIVAITQPSGNSVITGFEAIYGTIESAALARWELACRPVGGSAAWTRLASGTNPLPYPSQLGDLNPTAMMNGQYEIQLKAYDTAGNAATDSVNVVVQSAQKTGHFTLSYTDLTVPVAGIPIQITRTYDSRDKRVGAFGVGWTLGVADIRLELGTSPIGEGWRTQGCGFLSFCVVETTPHLVTVTMPDETVYAFQAAAGGWTGASTPDELHVVFNPLNETKGKAELYPIGGSAVEIIGGIGGERILYVPGSNYDTVYNPTEFALVLRDGRTLFISVQDGLEAIVDANGNRVDIDHEAGIRTFDASDPPQLLREVRFVRPLDATGNVLRDAQGNLLPIQKIQTLDAQGLPLQTLHYDIDSRGDLVRFADREGNTSAYAYDLRHNLVSIQDPRGIEPLRNEYYYDDNGFEIAPADARYGRLKSTTTAYERGSAYQDGGITYDEYRTEIGYDYLNDFSGGTEQEVTTWRGWRVSSGANAGATTRCWLGKTRTTFYPISINDPTTILQGQRVTTTQLLAASEACSSTEPSVTVIATVVDFLDRNNPDKPTSVTDPLGNTTHYTYSPSGDLLSVEDPLKNITSFTYNALGQRETATSGGVTTETNRYDARGNLLSTRNALGYETTSGYDAQTSRLMLKSDRNPDTGQPRLISRFKYDARGNIETATDAHGQLIRFTYDDLGNKTSQTTTRTKTVGTTETIETLTTAYVYDNNDRLVKTVFPDGATTQTVYNSIGEEEVSIDEAGQKTSYTYDALGRVTETAYPDNTVVKTTYHANGQAATVTDRYPANGDYRLLTRYSYDSLGRRVQTTYEPKSQTEPVTTIRTAYDAAGRTVSQTDENGHTVCYGYNAAGQRTSVTDALGKVTTYVYNKRNLLELMTDPDGRTTRYHYDDDGRLLKTLLPSGVVETQYDELGRRVAQTDADGMVTRYRYDRLGHLIEVVTPDDKKTTYSYDEAGNRVRQTDALGRTTEFEYDEQGRQTKRILPGLKDGTPVVETMEYDAAGYLLAKTDFRGKATTYDYDEATGELTGKMPDGSLSEPGVSFEYWPDGNRKRARRDGVSYLHYDYDARGRLKTVSDVTGTPPNEILVPKISYTYDAVGNRTSVKAEASGKTTTYTYDADNRLKGVFRNGVAVGFYEYDGAGNATALKRYNVAGDPATNASLQPYLTTTYDRKSDPNGWLREVKTTKSGGTVLSMHAYTLDAGGRREQVQETVNGAARAVGYTYDPVGRLLSETIAGGMTTTTTYTYYDNGNRKTRTVGNDLTNYNYDDNDRLTGTTGAEVATYTYTDNGNLQSDGTLTYTYDFEDRLLTVGNVSYVYDADGNRIRQTVGGTTTEFLVDANGPLAQVLEEKTGGAITHFDYGLELLRREDPSATVRNYVQDGLSSTRLLADGSGNFVTGSIVSYDAFGTPAPESNAYLFNGQRYDASTDLYFLRARYYQPKTGRFLTQDPLAGLPDNPVSLHRYLYASNDPVNIVDPSGEMGSYADTLSANAVFASLMAITSATVIIGAQTPAFRTITTAVVEGAINAGGSLVDAAELALALANVSVRAEIQTAVQTLARTKTWSMKKPKVIPMPMRIIPGVARNVGTAQARGLPRILTRVDSATAAVHRYQALLKTGGAPAGPGKSWDEYPFASSAQGGFPAQVASVEARENSIQGAIIRVCYAIERINLTVDPYLVLVTP